MKKFLSAILSFTLASSMVIFPAKAAETATVSIAKSGNDRGRTTITATAECDGAVSYEYQWVERTTSDGNYIELPTDTKNTYKVSTRDKNKYLNCKVTPIFDDNTKGTPVFASEDMHITNIGKQGRSDAADDDFKVKATPAEYKFTIEGYGREYVLMDWFNDSDAMAFVMQNDSYWASVFDSTQGHTKFETNCKTNIGYMFNSEEFKTYGTYRAQFPNSTAMDTKLLEYIDWNHVWYTEQGWDGDTLQSDDYSFVAGITVLSATEACKYYGRIGGDPKNNNSWYWTRTTRGDNTCGKNQVMVIKGSVGRMDTTTSNEPVKDGAGYITPYVNPVFYLNENFFKNVKLKVFDTDGNDILGSFVKNMLVNKYTIDELSSLYSDNELVAIGFEVPNRPIITTSNNAGYPKILTAAMNDENATTYEYQWIERTKNTDGTFTAYTDIRGDKGNIYYISTMDKNKYINCRVTPVFENGTKGSSVIAASDYFVENLGQYNRTKSENYPFPEETPIENTFKIEGQGRRYILLDEFTDVNSAFYIMDDSFYGQKMFDTEGKAKYDPTSDTNIAYYLNSEDFKTNGLNGVTMHPKIVEHVNWNHLWWTEAGIASSEMKNEDYSFTAGVGLLSITEAYKYYGKFGMKANTSNGWWWTRTQRAKDATDASNILTKKNGKEFWDVNGKTGAENVTPNIRATYFLDEDFFREVKLYDIGDNVKKIILNRYDKSELAGIYDEEELAEIGYKTSLSIENKTDNIYTPQELILNVNYTPSANEWIEIKVSWNDGEKIYYEDDGYEGEVISEEYVLSDVPYGTQELMVTITEGADDMASLSKIVYVIPEIETNYGQGGFGINPDKTKLFGTPDTHIKTLKKLGFNDIRVEFTWNGRTESTKNEYNTDYFKKMMNAAKENDVSVTALLAYNNQYYSSDSKNDKEAIDTLEERIAFVNYAKALVSAYPEIKKVEIWNEPNNAGFWQNGQDTITETDIANYAALLKDVSAALKEISPDINVYAGAIDVSKSPINYIEGMFENGAYNYMDTLSYHPYYHPNNVDSANADTFIDNRITPYKNVLRNAGGFKDLVATEFGFSSELFNFVGEEGQKREVPKGIVVMTANNIKNGNVFNYIDTNEAFGLLESDGTPRPLMYSLAQLNKVLNGSTFIGRLETDAGTTAYVFEKNGTPTIIAWSSTNATLEVNGTAIQVYDVYGNKATSLASQNIQLSLDPVYIENVDTSYLKLAYDNEIALRKNAISTYFTDLPEDISNAIKNDNSNCKTLIKENKTLNDAQKSALLDMIHEVEIIKASYNAIGISNDVEIPTKRYNNLKVSADNQYAKAALKYVYEYICKAQEEDIPAAIKTKNIAIATDLLDSAEILIKNEIVSEKIKISNVKKTDGVLTFDLTNSTDKNLNIYIATYDNVKLLGIQEAKDLSNLSFNVGNNTGKIFVWEKGNMKALIGATDF